MDKWSSDPEVIYLVKLDRMCKDFGCLPSQLKHESRVLIEKLQMIRG